jgi:hypothetical protein
VVRRDSGRKKNERWELVEITLYFVFFAWNECYLFRKLYNLDCSLVVLIAVSCEREKKIKPWDVKQSSCLYFCAEEILQNALVELSLFKANKPSYGPRTCPGGRACAPERSNLCIQADMFDSNSQMHLILSSMLNMMGKGQSKSVRIKNGITIIRKTHRSIQIRNEFGK